MQLNIILCYTCGAVAFAFTLCIYRGTCRLHFEETNLVNAFFADYFFFKSNRVASRNGCALVEDCGFELEDSHLIPLFRDWLRSEGRGNNSPCHLESTGDTDLRPNPTGLWIMLFHSADSAGSRENCVRLQAAFAVGTEHWTVSSHLGKENSSGNSKNKTGN